MFNRFNSVSRFTAEGIHIIDFINAIRQSDIVCSWLSSKKDVYFGQAYTKDMKTILDIAQEFDISIEEKSKKGFLYTLKKYRKRYGILIGILICFTIWIILSNVIVTIEIKGNKIVSDEVILSSLESVGIKKGAYIPNLDLRNGEYQLKLSNENIAWCSIQNTNGRLLVRVDEMVTSPEMLHDNNPCNLVAKTGATIVSFSVLNGQLMTPIGNGVTENEVLISGIFKNDKETVRYVHAMGTVIGEYEEDISLSQSLTEDIVITSNDKKIYKDLDLFGLKIPLYVGKKDTINSHVNTSTEYFKMFGNNIPIGIVTTECQKYVTNTITYSEEDAKKILQARKDTFEKNFLKDVKIMKVDENYTINEEKVTLELKYTLQGDICREVPIFIR
ncbi:MAG: sporulation protein YqfD [Oscillospiraceae bacterium]